MRDVVRCARSGASDGRPGRGGPAGSPRGAARPDGLLRTARRRRGRPCDGRPQRRTTPRSGGSAGRRRRAGRPGVGARARRRAMDPQHRVRLAALAAADRSDGVPHVEGAVGAGPPPERHHRLGGGRRGPLRDLPDGAATVHARLRRHGERRGAPPLPPLPDGLDEPGRRVPELPRRLDADRLPGRCGRRSESVGPGGVRDGSCARDGGRGRHRQSLRARHDHRRGAGTARLVGRGPVSLATVRGCTASAISREGRAR